jgi:hypothetical protein
MSASVHGLLDRERELGAIERALTVSHGGNGQVLVVEAEGGIGKTALLRLAADEGRAVGFRVLSAVASDASVHELKRTHVKDVVVMGSADLARTLMQLDAIDQYRLILHPSCSEKASACSGTARQAASR